MSERFWWRGHEAQSHPLRADAPVFRPVDQHDGFLPFGDAWHIEAGTRVRPPHLGIAPWGVEQQGNWQVDELLVALTSSSGSDTPATKYSSAIRKHTRGEKAAARRAGQQRLIDVARAAASRADVAEARVAQLEIEVADLRAKLSGAQRPDTASYDTMDPRALALMDEFLDRLGCSADFMAPLLARQRGHGDPHPSTVTRLKRNIANHVLSEMGVAVSEMTAKQLNAAKRLGTCDDIAAVSSFIARMEDRQTNRGTKTALNFGIDEQKEDTGVGGTGCTDGILFDRDHRTLDAPDRARGSSDGIEYSCDDGTVVRRDRRTLDAPACCVEPLPEISANQERANATAACRLLNEHGLNAVVCYVPGLSDLPVASGGAPLIRMPTSPVRDATSDEAGDAQQETLSAPDPIPACSSMESRFCLGRSPREAAHPEPDIRFLSRDHRTLDAPTVEDGDSRTLDAPLVFVPGASGDIAAIHADEKNCDGGDELAFAHGKSGTKTRSLRCCEALAHDATEHDYGTKEIRTVSDQTDGADESARVSPVEIIACVTDGPSDDPDLQPSVRPNFPCFVLGGGRVGARTAPAARDRWMNRLVKMIQIS